MTLLRTLALSGLAAVTITALAPAAKAAGPIFCAAYAQTAVAQQNKNVAKGCGFTGARWMNNAGLHYGWCLGATIAQANAETAARKAALATCGGTPTTKTFANPKYNGYRLDWCYTEATGCGAPAAKAFCVGKGYPLVKSYGQAADIGTFTKTRIIGNNHLCSGNFCDGFSFITCKK